MPSGCIFCRIIAGEASGDIIYRDDVVTVFRDIHPVAPHHLLIVPNKHIESLDQLAESDIYVAGRLLLTVKKIADLLGISQTGYRVIVNTGAHGGQVIHHLHIHLIGGQRMRFPMG